MSMQILETKRLILRPWRESDAELLFKYASDHVMEKCGFVDTGKETLCPGLEIGGDKPVRIMRLDYTI